MAVTEAIKGYETAIAVVALTTVIIVVNVLFMRKKPLVALDPKKEIEFEMIEREDLSHDTRRFRFALQSPEHILGLPIGKHMHLSATVNGKKVLRPYTPVTSDDVKGYFDLVIKTYFPNVHPKFPEGGKMTMHLEGMKAGDKIAVRGPSGKITYQGRGVVHVEKGKMKESEFKRAEDETVRAKSIGMIAGGSGITPMFQVIRAAVMDSGDNTQFHLIFANKTEDDILLRQELLDLERDHKNVRVWFTLDEAPADWKYSKGFVSKEMCAEHLPKAGPDTLVFLCGPPPMIKFACLPALQELGHDLHNIIEF